MLVENYEEIIRELEEIEINLDNISHNDLRHTLRTIVNRGWLQIETMFGQREQKRYPAEETQEHFNEMSQYSAEEIQEHFNEMLKVIPMTRVGDDT